MLVERDNEAVTQFRSQPMLKFDITCDFCATGSIEIEATQLWGAAKKLKELGWKIIYSDQDYKHACLDCVVDG